jgi:DNA-binding LacI/PurR family transcriptional regulator
MVDDYTGAFKAVDHLISRGCKRIALYSSPQHMLIGLNRFEGYKAALKKHGIAFNKDLVYACDTFDSAMKISRSVLKKQDRPDGIFAVNDITAIGVMKTARQLGINVPEELKVVGFENSRSSSICEPELTSVDQFGYNLGKKAAELLLKRIKDDTFDYIPENIQLKTELIIRGSS